MHRYHINLERYMHKCKRKLWAILNWENREYLCYESYFCKIQIGMKSRFTISDYKKRCERCKLAKPRFSKTLFLLPSPPYPLSPITLSIFYHEHASTVYTCKYTYVFHVCLNSSKISTGDIKIELSNACL